MPRVAGKDLVREGVRRPGARLAAPLAAAGALLLLCSGCSLDYGAAGEGGQAAAETPDTVALGVVHKIHRYGRLSLEMEAVRAETYNAKNETILTDFHFTEFDSKGAVATEGTARRVTFHSDTENAEIAGAVRVRSASEEGNVSAENLSWANKEKRLTAPPDEVVTIRKDDGSSLSGSGFQGDFRTREVTFSGPVKGTYVSKEDEK